MKTDAFPSIDSILLINTRRYHVRLFKRSQQPAHSYAKFLPLRKYLLPAFVSN